MTDETSTPQVAVLGGGVMGETLVSALLAAGWDADQVEVTERASARAEDLAGRYKVRTGPSNADAAGRADIVLVAVKPNVVGQVLDDIAPVLRDGTLVVTIAAVSCSSPFGPIQVSHSPAKAIGPPSRGRTQ